MMGMQAAPAQLFYDFCLDDHVPADHLLRRIDRFLDLEGAAELKPFYSHIGRPSIDPELMIRMLIVGYCMGIRSERRLCEEVHLNLAYRWFCRLGLDGKVPDHSTFSLNRHGRFRQSDILRHLFETVVERCLREGLVGGEGFAVDASLIAADANKQRSVRGDQWRNSGLDADAGAPFASIWPLSTMQPSARPARSRPSSSHRPIRRHNGLARTRACLLRLCHQLSDRHRQCDYPRCRGEPRHPPGGGRRLPHHARPHRRTLRVEAAELLPPTAPMARPRTWPGWSSSADRAAYPVFDKSSRTDGTLSRSDFVFDADATITPARRASCWSSSIDLRDAALRHHQDGTRLYRASKRDCQACAQVEVLPEHAAA